MAGTEPPLVVADAGPIIHLDELGCLDLLVSTLHVSRSVLNTVIDKVQQEQS